MKDSSCTKLSSARTGEEIRVTEYSPALQFLGGDPPQVFTFCHKHQLTLNGKHPLASFSLYTGNVFQYRGLPSMKAIYMNVTSTNSESVPRFDHYNFRLRYFGQNYAYFSCFPNACCLANCNSSLSTDSTNQMQ